MSTPVNPFGKMADPTAFKCRWCGKNYFAYKETPTKGCNFCADPHTDLNRKLMTATDRLLETTFGDSPPHTYDPSLPEEALPPNFSMPPQSLPPGYPKTYGAEDSPNVVRDQWGNITSYWNGQRWAFIQKDGAEW